jgi:hypothetical protein
MALYLCYNGPLWEHPATEGDKMSQYYPQQGPYYLPEDGPEDDFYYEEGDYDYEDDGGSKSPWVKYGLGCLAVGCLSVLCLACCGLVFGGLFVADPTTLLAPPTPPGADLGLTFDEAANPDEAVVNDQQTRLTILDVNRNASLDTAPLVEGREFIIITVEVVNIGQEDIKFNERDFLLLNQREEAYEPLAGGDVIDGVLGRGSLPPGEGLEGRLVFQVLAGEGDLVLAWEGDGGSRYIYLE